MQLTIFLAHEFALANYAPTLRDKIAADAGVGHTRLRPMMEEEFDNNRLATH